jgi:HEAT repeat protein
MGLFDIFKGKSDAKPKARDKDIARMTKLVSTKMSQNYDRQEALEELGRIETAQSAAALLKRFDWTMEPSITDQEEKETAMRGVIAAGEEALDPIREHCKRAESLTWPLRTLRGIVSEDSYAEELLGILDLFDAEYVRNPEPKIQLIALLEELPSADVRIAVEPFLQDASEPVRFAAVTTVFAMNDAESIESLVAALVEEESLRVRNRIAQGFADRSWDVPESLQEGAREALPPEYALDGSKILRVG